MTAFVRIGCIVEITEAPVVIKHNDFIIEVFQLAQHLKEAGIDITLPKKRNNVYALDQTTGMNAFVTL
jgi:hypothetical protein